MKLLGLTGSIGMGKSTTAKMFAAAGAPVYDADAAVHALYRAGGPAGPLIEAAFPGAAPDGAVDRARLSELLMREEHGLQRLEAIIHPLLAADRATALALARSAGSPVFVLDIPLLFETGGEAAMDAVVVVSAPADVQRARVLARPGMTPEKFEAILRRQMPDAEKRLRADFVIDTGEGLEAARLRVLEILHRLSSGPEAGTS